jgi:hypothetical protein
VWEAILHLVVLRREVIRFGYALLSNLDSKLVALMHVVRDGVEIIEEFAKNVPSALAFHNLGTEQVVAGNLDRLLQKKRFAVGFVKEAEALELSGQRTVRGLGGGREPALVDASPFSAEGVYKLELVN